MPDHGLDAIALCTDQWQTRRSDGFRSQTGRYFSQLDVLDQQLADKTYMCGDNITIADFAIWPWYGQLVLGRLYSSGEFLDVESYTNVYRWARQLDKRPAVLRDHRHQAGRPAERTAEEIRGGPEVVPSDE